jgi:SAM-dependent methyltransferase
LFLGLLAATGRIASGRGFDLNPRAIAVAETMARGLSSRGCTTRLMFSTGSADAEWPDGQYDVISIIDLAHHLPRTVQHSLVQRAATRLQAGGILLYKDMVRRPFWRAWANRAHDLVLARQWIQYWPIEELDSQARQLGWTRCQAQTLPMLWYGHELRVYQRPPVGKAGTPVASPLV